MRYIRAYYYSFVIAFALVMTMTLFWMFFSKGGMVMIGEPNIAIRVAEILIGISLIVMSTVFIRQDVLKHRKRIEIDYDKESNTFWVTDSNIEYWSSFPMGDVIIDMDKKGRIKGFEILNAGKLNIDMEEHDKIMKLLKKEKKNASKK